MFSRIQPYLPVLIASAAFLALGLLCFFSAQRALERSRKQLSWVKRHGDGGYVFDRAAFPDARADWLGVFGVAVFALVTAMFCSVVRSLYVGGGGIRAQIAARSPLVLGFSWLGKLFSLYALLNICLCVLGAIAMYLLLQRLCGSTLISACGSLLAAASFVGSHAAGAMLTVSLLFLVWWLSAPQRPLWSPAELLYYAACLSLAAAIALCPVLLVLVPLLIGFRLFKLIGALRRGELSFGGLALCLALSLLVWVLALVAFVLLRGLLYCGLSVSTFMGRMRRFGFFGVLKSVCKTSLKYAFVPLMRSRILLPLMDAPLLGIGGLGAVSALLLWTRRQDARAKLVLPILGAALLPWLLGDVSVLGVPLTLCAALLFHNFVRGGRKLPVILLTLLGICYYLGFYFLAHYLPLSESLIIRLS